MKTLDQKRAADAWRVIEEVKDLKPDERDQFGIQAKKLPTRIMASGLGQALAFLEAKKYAPRLRQALAEWINKRPIDNPPNNDRLVLRVINGNAEFLRYATAECLAYLQWLVKFADAEGIGKDDTDTPQQAGE